ncbi:Fatty acid-binding protein type 3 [Fasciola hepatica]|uniref:Fatty acid-binding protein type 3 n=1 Tax=Fasciola hepatica TaxID=6192 RepID=A0A4E0RIB8_FASHE|nr:Fatty acid-binding protein type 3 [Fasciola hepatica]
MANFVGSWKLVHTENMDALLQNLGINSVKRKFITSSKPEITFTLEGNTMHMKTASPLKTVVISFTFGEEFKEETADGRTVMTTVTKDSDNKISQVQKSPKNTTHVVREIIHNKMIVTATVGDVRAVNTYQKV